MYTLLDGEAGLAVEDVDISETNVELGEEVVFAHLDERFPDEGTADRLGKAMEERYSGRIRKNETMEAHAGSERWARARLIEEGVNHPQVARGDPILHGARLGNFSRATTASATSRRWHWDEECTAIRPAFPGASRERLAQAARAAAGEVVDCEFSPPGALPGRGRGRGWRSHRGDRRDRPGGGVHRGA